jgi:hypothetical protein
MVVLHRDEHGGPADALFALVDMAPASSSAMTLAV